MKGYIVNNFLRVFIFLFFVIAGIKSPPNVSSAYAAKSALNKAPWQEIWTLNDVAPTFLEIAKHSNKVAAVYSQAFKLADAISGDRSKSWALNNIAQSCVKIWNYDAALEIVNAMKLTSAKEYALASLAESYAKAWQFEKALQVANRITETWQQEQALANIAKSLAKAEAYARARQVANRITNTWTKEQSLADIAGTCSNLGKFELAMQIADAITDTGIKMSTLGSIGASYAKAGQPEKAAELFTRALDMADSIDDTRSRMWSLVKIAEALAASGQRQSALKAYSRALMLVNASADERTKSGDLSYIAESLAKSEEYEKSLDAAYKVSDSDNRNWALTRIVEFLAQAGDFESANRIKNSNSKEIALGRIAVRLADRGEDGQALEIARSIANSAVKVRALAQISERQALSEKKEQASKLLALALQTALLETNPRVKIRALCQVAESIARIGPLPLEPKHETRDSKTIDELDLYGIYARGDCQSPVYILFYLEDIQIFVSRDYATLKHSIFSENMGQFVIQQWQTKNEGYEVIYFQPDRNTLRLYPGGIFKNQQSPEYFQDKIPENVPPFELNKCDDIPPDISFLHAEGIAFMKSLYDLTIQCENEKERCLEFIFSVADISHDQRLSKAEISRILWIFTYIAVVSGKEDMAKTEEITGISAIVSIICPSIAGSIIAGSDYDNDGQLSLDEMFYDRNIKGAAQTFEKFSFDVAVSMLTKMFGSIDSLLKFIR